MASNIVPDTIDDAYPVAGQDNDSQGFRDNFNIIKTNFTYAKVKSKLCRVILRKKLKITSFLKTLSLDMLQNKVQCFMKIYLTLVTILKSA